MSLQDKEAVLRDCAGRWADFYSQFTELKRQGEEWRGPCPLHGGDGPNFTVNAGTGLWHCFTGCNDDGGDALRFLERRHGLSFPEALQTLAEWAGTPPAPLPVRNGHKNGPTRRIVAAYDYSDEAGELLFQAVRYEPKGFSQRAPTNTPGVWTYSLGEVRRVLYRLPEVLAAVDAGKPVFVCEGEKDTDALRALGLCATTSPMGAGKWEDAYTEALCNAGVVLLPDNDTPGRQHAQKVAAALHGTAKRVRVVQLPNLPDKGDVSDWLAAGGTKAALLELAKAAPDWKIEDGTPTPVSEAAPRAAAEGADGFAWPVLAPEALHGLAGDVVQAIEPHTEADPVALLVQFLLAFGSCIGRGPHYLAEGDKHGGNLFAVLVGVSSKGRKGTSWGRVRPFFESAAFAWTDKRVLSGLSSGEGLIHAVRDPLEKQEKNKKTGEMETLLVDAGVDDKRLLVLESEFASVLRQTQRDGNTLSATVRNAWDTGTLRSMTKNSPAQATGAHISIVGHITAGELKKDLAETEYANGFGNRFLWVCVKRSKELPFGGDMDSVNTAPLVARLRAVLEHAQGTGRMLFDSGARGLWADVYHDLSSGKPGLLGAMTGRSEAQVCRLALLYALQDLDTTIRVDHLTAALALWEYCEASARFIFGDSLGDRVADDILRALRETPDGMSRTDLRDLFQKNQTAERIGQALALLAGQGVAHMEQQAAEGGKGRPVEVWKAAN